MLDSAHYWLKVNNSSMPEGLSMATKHEASSKEGQWPPEQQLKELKRRMDASNSDMCHTKPSFQPNPDDVIVAVPPKNGITWMMHICHQIRMRGGEPDFEDQLQVITWIEASEKVHGVDPASKPQPASPRVFVTHLPFPSLPSGGKRIYCFRDQKDVVLSAYYFYDSKLSLRGRVSMSIFADVYLERIERHLNELLLWWECRHESDTLLLFFDDVMEDHAGCVRRIAEYIGVDLDDDAVTRVVHTTTHAEMVRHHSKFSSRRHTIMVAKKIGEEPPSQSEFVGRVRKDGGKSGEGKQKLPVEVQQRIDQMWQEIVTSKLGFQDLKEMREAWKRELLRT